MGDYNLIRNTMAWYCKAIDSRKFEDLDKAFDEDSVWITAIGVRVEGLAAIKQVLEVLVQYRAGTDSHLVYNVIVDIDGDEARSTSDWLFLAPQGTDGSWKIGAAGSYEDVLRRKGERWVFAERKLIASSAGLFSGS